MPPAQPILRTSPELSCKECGVESAAAHFPCAYSCGGKPIHLNLPKPSAQLIEQPRLQHAVSLVMQARQSISTRHNDDICTDILHAQPHIMHHTVHHDAGRH